MSWRVAKSLLRLQQQIDDLYPDRSKASDGTIGDAAHQTRVSDHNPNANGVVTALDITNDPAHGVDAGNLAELLRLSEDKRIKYVISNRRIFNSTVSPWIWRSYSGSDPHTEHLHISVSADPALYDDDDDWTVDRLSTAHGATTQSNPFFENITATVFGGAEDPNKSAYDQHQITDQELGVALPFKFAGERPKVIVSGVSNGKSVTCDVVDIGPWNTSDPYWLTGGRPQAESGRDLSGRATNKAGIDLTPAAAKKIGLDGKGLVNWTFASPVTPVYPTPIIAKFMALLDALRKSTASLGETAMTQPTDATIATLQQLLAAFQTQQQTQISTVPSTSNDTQKLLEALKLLLNPQQPLGTVNGALGDWIGNLLNGKKTAIGIIGSLLTSLLSVASVPGGPLASLPFSASALGPYALPIFLAIGAWGVLGKFEKWNQASGT